MPKLVTRTARSLHELTAVVFTELPGANRRLSGSWIFRGQTQKNWQPIPQILRSEYIEWLRWHKPTTVDRLRQEKLLLDAFRMTAIAHLPTPLEPLARLSQELGGPEI